MATVFDSQGSGGTAVFDSTAPSAAQPAVPVATLVTLTGPSSGYILQPSANFTVSTDNPVASSVTVTPAATGGGYFVPSSVTLTATTTTATFVYVPDVSGMKSVSVSNNGGLSNPAPISYQANAQPGGNPIPVRTGGDDAPRIGKPQREFKKSSRDDVGEDLRAAMEIVKANEAAKAKAKPKAKAKR